ncbi:hypothetical protein P261_00774 [Lachnospiraceae bacterium TWA4]|nr:hypothetical protein P261_00774 [Lachnospiraceae bacterium TWA4]
MYVVNGTTCYFISKGNVYTYTIKTKELKEVISDGKIQKMVPTVKGIIYAKGKLFHWDVYVDHKIIVKGAKSFYEMDNYFYFTKDDKDFQISFEQLFTSKEPSKEVESYKPKTSEEILFSDLDGITTSRELKTAAEQTAVKTSSTDNYISGLDSATKGQKNTIKRARQQAEIVWIPLEDITSWANREPFEAGKEYKGVPYGQPVNAKYVPWSASLEEFLESVNDPKSKMYTSKSTYNKVAPYYSSDCSSFVSWSLQLDKRKTTSTLNESCNKVESQDIYNVQIGDILVKRKDHTVLISDVGYDSDGNIVSIEIIEQTPPSPIITRYGVGGTKTLANLTQRYFESNYILYRSKTINNVTYKHSCAVPLEGDNCSKCTVSNSTSNEEKESEKPKESEPKLEAPKIVLNTPVIKKASIQSSGNLISWNHVSNAKNYKVYRMTKNGNWSEIGTTTSTTYTDSNALFGISYYYSVSACSNSLESDKSKQSNEMIRAYSSYPMIKTAKITSKGTVLTWDKMENCTGYYLYRKELNGSWARIATLSAGKTTYTDTKASKYKAYYYTIRAYSSADGSTVLSKYESVLRKGLINITLVNGANGIEVKWSNTINGAEYLVYRRMNASQKWEKAFLHTKATSYIDKKVNLGSKYQYAIKVKYQGKVIVDAEYSRFITRVLPAPSAKFTVTKRTVKITWKKVVGAKNYQIYYRKGNGDWKRLKTTTGTSFETSVKSAGNYSYRIRAYAVVNEKGYYSSYTTSKVLKIK